MDPRVQQKTDETLRFLMSTLAEVLTDDGRADVAARLPWLGEAAAGPRKSFPAEIAERCVQAYSLAFQLLDQAEENATAQARRAAEDEGRLAEESGSWAQNFALLRDMGFDESTVAEGLSHTRVEPVLTAHPTEAKRQTVLEHQRSLYRLLVELENSMWTRAERRELQNEVRAWIERLIRTGEIYLEKPSLQDERRMVLHYLRRVFPRALPRTHQRLRAAWEQAGFDPERLSDPSAYPRIVFGNWVGGDRDGHPLVDAQFTVETLGLFRQTALELVQERLEELAVRLSLSENRQPVPEDLTAEIGTWSELLGSPGAAAVARNREEPWREYVNLMRVAVPARDAAPQPGQLQRASDLLERLRRLAGWLDEIGARRLVESDVDPVITLVQTTGYHLATVDIRQNSAFHDKAIAQLLTRAGVRAGETYEEWSLERRRALLDLELESPRPLTRLADVEGPQAQAVVDLYTHLADHRQQFGGEGLGALIVSMTRSAEDLLAVYILAREGGLLEYEGRHPWVPMPVVPLFETIEDLERAPAIMEDYLSQPVVLRSLDHQAVEAGSAERVQQVMIGYSDSGKDGGIVSSMWSLYRAQSAIAEVGRRHGVRIRFFHGRGGTIGRGAGPTHRFVRALPPGTVQGDLRVTEQGETIRQKYANLITAAHHLELLSACAMSTTIASKAAKAESAELMAAMDRLAETSRRTYRALVEHDGFVAFFERATPIDAIEASRIGSRPARRPGERKLSNLRAIPWVFAWNQARFVLPGWFGLGSALIDLKEHDPSAFEQLRSAKRAESRWPPLHYLISNAATAWSTASEPIMRRYAELAGAVPEADALMARIREEYDRTREGLEAIYEAPLPQARPNVHLVLMRREEALEPLHAHQIQLLETWRGMNPEDGSRLIPALLRTINAIASGLGATG